MNHQVLHNPLHIYNAFKILAVHSQPCGLRLSYRQNLGNSISVRPIVGISCAWRACNFRASAYFAMRVLRKMSEQIVLSSCSVRSRCFVDAWKEELLELVSPRQLEIRLSKLKIPLSIRPRMVEAILVILFTFTAHVRPQLVPASDHPQLGCGDRLLTRQRQPTGMLLSVLHSMFSHS